MRRRDFLISGVKACLCLVAYDSLALRGFGKPPTQPADLTPALNDSLHILAKYITLYSPPAGNFPANGSWKATYDLVDFGHARAKTVNRVFGQATVTRRPSGDRIQYEVDYTNAIYDFRTSLKSSLQCSSGLLPGLVEWQTDYETHVDSAHMIERIPNFGHSHVESIPSTAPPMSLSEKGSHKNGVLEFVNTLGNRRIKTDRPVLSQWTLLDALRNAKADASTPMAGVEFDFLHDMTSYRARQRLIPLAALQIAMGGGAVTALPWISPGRHRDRAHPLLDRSGRAPVTGYRGAHLASAGQNRGNLKKQS